LAETKVRNVGIMVFQNVELLDFTGPYEAFSAVGRNETALFNTFMVAESLEPVR
jgi:hypothetical protein